MWFQRKRLMDRPVTVREMVDCLDTIQRISNQVLDVARVHVCDQTDSWCALLAALGNAIEEEADAIRDLEHLQ